MRKVKLYGCFILGIMALTNYFFANNDHKNATDLVMTNIEALHASAAEVTCDLTIDKECAIVVHTNPMVVGWSWGNKVFSN